MKYKYKYIINKQNITLISKFKTYKITNRYLSHLLFIILKNYNFHTEN